MTATAFAASHLSADEHGVQLRRAVVASTIGTAIEWYDFFLYSIVTGLVFAKLFFPHSDPLVVIAGGPAPLIAAWLFARYHSGHAVAAYILACSVVTLIATAMMRDYTGKDLEAAHK
jgi:hypothetical protein